MKLTTKQIVLIGLFTAVTVIFSQISIKIPISPVPITFQALAVFLSAIILGSKAGTLSLLVYILLGAIGLPVFANFKGGLGVIFGATGGFIISFPIIAWVMGKLLEKKEKVTHLQILLTSLLGLAICYALGTAWLAFVAKLSLEKALMAAVVPFIPLDLVKIVVATVLGYQVRNALVKAKLLSV